MTVEQRPDHSETPRSSKPSTLGTVITLGSTIAGSIIVGLLLGLFLDSQAGTSPLFLLLGIFLGIAAAGFALKAAATRLGGAKQ